MKSFKVWLGESKEIAHHLSNAVMDNVPKTHSIVGFKKTGSLRDNVAYLVHTKGPLDDAPLVAHYVSFSGNTYKYKGNSI